MSSTLRRVLSSPELRTAQGLKNEYVVGSILHLRIRSGSEPSLRHRHVPAEIIKIFEPFSMAPVMVVRIDDLRLDLKGDFVLKVYDRHYTEDMREDYHVHELNTGVDMEFHQYILTNEGRTLMQELGNCGLFEFSDEQNESSGTEEGENQTDDDSKVAVHMEHLDKGWFNKLFYRPALWERLERLVARILPMFRTDKEQILLPAEDSEDNSITEEDNEAEDDSWRGPRLEAWVHANCQKMYHSESEAYRRMKDRWGIDIPRLVAYIDIPGPHSSKSASSDVHSDIEDVPGILIQYIRGFPLSALYKHPESLSVPRNQWQRVIDEAVTIVNTMGKREICNRDVDVRNTIVHFDPIAKHYTSKLIDFGLCIFRKADMSDWDWRCEQSAFDEEGSIGRHMELMLMKKGDRYAYTRSKYHLALDREFREA